MGVQQLAEDPFRFHMQPVGQLQAAKQQLRFIAMMGQLALLTRYHQMRDSAEVVVLIEME